MSDQSASKFHQYLYKFLGDCDVEGPGFDILDTLIGRENPMTLEELAAQVFRNLPPEDRIAYEEEYGKQYKVIRTRKGIAELQGLAVPILTTEDEKYRLGDSITDVWQMIDSLEKDIQKLRGFLNTAHMNLGRLLEAYEDIDG